MKRKSITLSFNSKENYLYDDVASHKTYGNGRRKLYESVDLSLDYGSESFIFRDRISHTSDLDAFDSYMKDLRSARENDSEPVCEKFWEFIRNILEKTSKPCDFEANPNVTHSNITGNRDIINYSPSDASKFYQKYAHLAPVNPINPLTLSSMTNIPASVILSELLHATLIGFVSMLWAPKCNRCGASASTHTHLKDLQCNSICQTCLYENQNSSASNVMILFALNQRILYTLQKAYGCQFSKAANNSRITLALCPADNNGLPRRVSIGCGNENMLHPTLPPGSYRMRCPLARTDFRLRVRSPCQENEEPIVLKLPVSSIEHVSPTKALKVINAEHGKIHFDIYTDTNTIFGLVFNEDIEDDLLKRIPPEDHQISVTASELFHNPFYLKHFPNQTIQKTPHLSIELVYLVFTDVIGSTNLYSEVGDTEALRVIQQHFQVLFSEFSRNGRVVKTIGDSVMASFLSGKAAIEAVSKAIINVRKNCINSNGNPLQIRAGIHCGSALVVPLNGVHDYFGQTVNLAARVEAAAGASECLMTRSVLSHSDAIEAHKKTYEQDEFSLILPMDLRVKGIEEAINVTGFRM